MIRLTILIILLFSTTLLHAQWTTLTDRSNNLLVVGDTILVVAQNVFSTNRLKYSTDGGDTFSDPFALTWTGNEPYDIGKPVFANNRFYLFARNNASGILRSGASLVEWEICENGIEIQDGYNRLPDIINGFNIDDVLYVYTSYGREEGRRVYKSADGGDNWVMQADNVPAFGEMVSGNGKIYALGGSGVFVSEDEGVTFNQVHEFTSGPRNRDLEVSGETIAILRDADNVFTVDYSLNAGQDWKTIQLNALYNHLGNYMYVSGKRLYISSIFTEETYFIDLNDESLTYLGAATFLFANIQLRKMWTSEYQQVGNKLYAIGNNGTNGFLVVRNLDDVGTNIEHDFELPNDYALEQNYPNPFNPSTTISFSIPESARARIDLFNTAGLKVMTVADRVFEAGAHSIQFNSQNLQSGVYFYRLVSKNIQITKKMTLLK